MKVPANQNEMVLTKVDVISDDKKLVEIYVAVVKEFAIKYGVYK